MDRQPILRETLLNSWLIWISRIFRTLALQLWEKYCCRFLPAIIRAPFYSLIWADILLSVVSNETEKKADPTEQVLLASRSL